MHLCWTVAAKSAAAAVAETDMRAVAVAAAGSGFGVHAWLARLTAVVEAGAVATVTERNTVNGPPVVVADLVHSECHEAVAYAGEDAVVDAFARDVDSASPCDAATGTEAVAADEPERTAMTKGYHADQPTHGVAAAVVVGVVGGGDDETAMPFDDASAVGDDEACGQVAAKADRPCE